MSQLNISGIWNDLLRGGETIRWVGFGLAGCALVSAGVVLIWRIFRRKISPEEVERLRREAINARGKIGDGEIVDVDGSVITYSYSVGGVEYMVAQDASSIERLLPSDRMLIVGSASVRYDPKNPPNSIVVSETWSGLRPRAAR